MPRRRHAAARAGIGTLLLLGWFCLAAAPTRPPAACAPSDTTAGGGVVVDDSDRHRVEITAYWISWPAGATCGAYGATVLSDGGTGADGVVRFRPALPAPGRYEVALYWPALRDTTRRLASNASVTVHHDDALAAFTVDQQARAGAWYVLGTYPLTPRRAWVEVRNDAADGIVLADAVRFRPVD